MEAFIVLSCLIGVVRPRQVSSLLRQLVGTRTQEIDAAPCLLVAWLGAKSRTLAGQTDPLVFLVENRIARGRKLTRTRDLCGPGWRRKLREEEGRAFIIFHQEPQCNIIQTVVSAAIALSYPGIIPMQRYFTELATAFVRGRLNQPHATIETGLQAGLRLHKFKQNTELPRVRTVLGILRSLQPENLLDIGSGRGAFLWPLLADFPYLPVTATEIADRRSSDLAAVRKGGVQRLTVVSADMHRLPFAPRSFDVVTMLEVLEHLAEPQLALREGLRSARRFVVVSVPSTPDENPEHLRLFSIGQLKKMAVEAGATRTTFEHVPNHRIMLAQIR